MAQQLEQGGVTLESAPGAGMMVGFDELTDQQKHDYHVEKMKLVEKALADAGIQVRTVTTGNGYWSGTSNLVTRFVVKPDQVQIAAQIAADVVGDQEMVGWNKPIEGSRETNNGLVWEFDRDLTQDEVLAIGKALDAAGLPVFPDNSTPSALRVINFDGSLAGKMGEVAAVVRENLPSTAVVKSRCQYTAESNIEERSNGEERTRRLHSAPAGAPLAGRAVADAHQEVQSLNQRFGLSTEARQSVTLRTGEETLSDFGINPGERATVRVIAQALEERQQKLYGKIDKKDYSDAAMAKIANWMVAEVLFEINSGSASIGWYSQKYQRAMDIAEKRFPSLKSPVRRGIFTLLTAITSDGAEVQDNFKMALELYGSYDKDGVFEKSTGHARTSSNNVAILQKLISERGEQGALDFLSQERPVGELNKIARAAKLKFTNDYLVTETMPMAALVLGPKVGVFFANLSGMKGYLTMDRWWSRTFNRYRGDIVTEVTDSSWRRLREMLGKPNLSFEQTLEESAKLAAAAKAKKWKGMTPLEVAGNNVYKQGYEKLNDAPLTGSERSFMIRTTKKAQELLAEQGHELTTADIQAVLWYYEKALYGHLGGSKKSAKSIGYDTAAEMITTMYQGGGAVSAVGVHYSPVSGLTELDPSRYGTGSRGVESRRLSGLEQNDPLRKRTFFYEQVGDSLPEKELAVRGGNAYTAQLNNLYDLDADHLGLRQTSGDLNGLERSIIDKGFDGYIGTAPGIKSRAIVVLNQKAVPVNPVDAVTTVYQPGPIWYSALSATINGITKIANKDGIAGVAQVKTWLAARQQEGKFKKSELEAVGVDEWLDLQGGKVNVNDLINYVNSNGVQIDEVLLGTSESVRKQRRERLSEIEAEREILIEDLVKAGVTHFVTTDEKKVLERADDYKDQPEIAGKLRKYAASIVEERQLRRETNHPTKFGGWRVPGSSNDYHELLLTMPPIEKPAVWRFFRLTDGLDEPFGPLFRSESEALLYGRSHDLLNKPDIALDLQSPSVYEPTKFKSGHWNQPNVLAHVRFDTRTGADGKPVLFIQEIQSDWAQQGRERGFKNPHPEPLDLNKLVATEGGGGWYYLSIDGEHVGTTYFAELKSRGYEVSPEGAVESFLDRIGTSPLYADNEGIEPAPFVTDTKAWVSLVIKRMIRYAAENDFSKVAFATGDQNIELYPGLETMINKITWDKQSVDGSGLRSVTLDMRNNDEYLLHVDDAGVVQSANSGEMEGEHLASIIGAEPAKKILGSRSGDLSGSGLSTGGHGMRNFYDVLVPSIANDVLKKLGGGKVGTVMVDHENTAAVPDIQIVRLPSVFTQDGIEMERYDVYTYDDNKLRLGIRDTLEGARKLKRAAQAKYDAGLRPAANEFVVTELDGTEFISTPVSYSEAAEAVRADFEVDGVRSLSIDAFFVDPSIGRTQPGFEITEKMKARALEGQALFQPEDKGPRGALQWTGPDGKREFNLALLKNQNKSTVFHELGHFYLELIGDLATMPNATVEAKEDFARIMKWLGVTDRSQIKTEHHEKFADGHLAYLLEGKAPVAEMIPAFKRFSNWLSKIGQKLMGVQVEMNDEVRDIFDRLYATDEELAAAQEMMPELFATAEDMGITQAEFNVLSKKRAKAVEQSHEKLLSRLMRQIAQDDRTERREAKKKIREEVTNEIDSSPEYAALAMLVSGENGKLNSGLLSDLFGADVLKAIDRRAVSTNGTLDPDAAATLAGFESGEDLVQALSGLPARQSEIARETNSRYRAAYPTDLDDGTLRARAVAAANGDARGEVLAAELEILSRKADKILMDLADKADQKVGRQFASRTQTLKSIRAAAIAHIDSLPLHKINPWSFFQAQQKASREAYQAALKQDFIAAKAAQERALLNHHLFNEATKRLDRQEKIREWLVKHDSSRARTVLAKAGDEFLAQYDALRDRFSVEREPNKTIERRKTLAQFAADLLAADKDAVIDPELLDETRTKNWREFTPPELEGLYSALKNIYTLANHEVYATIEGQKIERAAMLDEIIGTAKSNATKLKELMLGSDPRRKKAGHKIRTMLSGADASMTKMELIAHWLDGGDVNGPFHRYVWNRISKAQTEEYEWHAKLTAKMAELMDVLPKSKLHSYDTDMIQVGGMGAMSRGQVLTMLLYSGQPERRTKLLEGYASRGLTEGDLNNALDKLDRFDIELANKVWSLFEEFGPEVRALEKRLTGVEPEWTAPTKMKLKGGEANGGYFPLVHDTKAPSSGISEKQQGGTVGELFGNGYVRARTSQSHVQELTGATYPLMLDYRFVLTGALANQIKDLTHREAVLDIRRIFENKGFKKMIQEVLGEEYQTQFMPWLAHAVNERNAGFARASSAWSQILTTLRGNAVAAMLGFKTTTVLMQVLDLPRVTKPGAGQVKGRYMTQGLMEWLAHPVATSKEIDEKSGEMKFRAENLDRDMRANMQKWHGDMSWLARWNRKAYKGLTAMDYVTSRIAWWGSYKQALASGADEKTAVLRADETVRLKLQGGNPKDLPAISRSDNEMMKLLTMFMGDATPNYTMLRDLGHNIDGMKGIPSFTYAAMAIMASQILADIIRGQGPDDDEDEVMWAARKAMLAPASTVPFVRDLANSVDGVLQGDPMKAEYRFTPLITVATKGLQSLASTKKLIGDEEEWEDWGIKQASFVGYAFGVGGTSQAEATSKYLRRYQQGEESPDNVAQFLWDAGRGKRRDR